MTPKGPFQLKPFYGLLSPGFYPLSLNDRGWLQSGIAEQRIFHDYFHPPNAKTGI